MHELDEKLKTRGLRVVAVTAVDEEDMAEERDAVASVAKEHRIDYPCLLDADGQWMKSAGIEGVPTFVVIGRDGKLTFRYRGSVKPGSEAYQELEGAVERALGPS